MDKTQKTILYVTTIILAILVLIILGKLFMFERGKEKTSGEIDTSIVNKLYNYLPEYNDYQLESIYNKFSSFENLNINIIEAMIVNYLVNNDKDKLKQIDNNDSLDIGLDTSQYKLLYKISKEDLEYGLKMVFGNNRNIVFKDVSIDKKTMGKYLNNILFVYQIIDNIDNNDIVYRSINRYSIDDDKTIKIYDYYVICDKSTSICYNDDKKNIENSYITYSNGIEFDDYKNNMKQYEHTFKYDNGNYYWLNSKAM